MIDFLSAIILVGVLLGVWLQRRRAKAASPTRQEENYVLKRPEALPASYVPQHIVRRRRKSHRPASQPLPNQHVLQEAGDISRHKIPR